MNTFHFPRSLVLSALITVAAPGLVQAGEPALAGVTTTTADDNTSGVPRLEEPDFDRSTSEIFGRALAEHAESFDQGWLDEVMQGVMTLYDADGDSVRRTYSRLTIEHPNEGDKLLVRFLSPAEIKGVAALTHENPGSSDDNWLYLPATKRVRRISGANKTASFQGTEFTYEDLSNLDPSEYEWRFLEETTLSKDGKDVPVWRLEAIPTYEDTGYSRLVVSYHKSEWRREQVEYFDKAGRHLKTLHTSEIELFHGRFWRALTIEMTNEQTGKSTKLEVDKIFLNLSLYKSKRTGEGRDNLTDDSFTTRALEG